MLAISQAFLAVLIAAPPTETDIPMPTQVVELENATVTLSPDLARNVKIELVKTPAGPRLRLVAGGMTLEATRFTIKEEGKAARTLQITVSRLKDGLTELFEPLHAPVTPPEKK